jgi:Holliday junction DNA helicase RuvA
MISRLSGSLVECRPEYVVVDVGGVGYRVQIPLGTYYTLASGDSSRVTLHIHTHVREDALQLYGFDGSAERAMFEKLIAISGIGPRVALAILSGLGADELRECVNRQDRARLEKTPGIGRKTAERVLLELRDKLGEDKATADGAGDHRPVRPEDGAVAMREDAISALVNLGYTRERATRAVERSESSGEVAQSLEGLLKKALSGLSG